MSIEVNKSVAELVKVLENYEKLDKESINSLNDAISMYIGWSSDQWLCCNCLMYGGEDMPDEVWICSECVRPWCERCKEERNNVCKCGTKIE